jgi:hypothetical protein
VKALVPAGRYLLPLARVGYWPGTGTFRALGGCGNNKPVEEAKAGSDHGREQQTKG